jgi:hypothetical protein
MVNVFIDSNIWLSLYDYSSNDLSEFNKFKLLVNKEVNLLVTQQVKDEINRNRDAKIKSVMDKFKVNNITFPNICKGYTDEYKKLTKAVSDYKTSHSKIIELINNDIPNVNLHADRVIRDIFESANVLPVTEQILAQAKYRFDVGNPPGKDRSYGDAINWVTLLCEINTYEDLHFVSSDKDYRSIIDDCCFNSFLLHEWKSIKNSELYYYPTLNEFTNKHTKNIELKSENDKELAINALFCSSSFVSTHNAIADLNNFSNWTNDQIEQLCQIALDNNQVYRILGDTDVYDFYLSVVRAYPDTMNNEYVNLVIEKLEDAEIGF